MKVDPPELPTAAWRYEDPAYRDPAKLERELRRVAEICHQCRRCLPLCPSFPRLFELIDASPNEVAGVSLAGLDEVRRGLEKLPPRLALAAPHPDGSAAPLQHLAQPVQVVAAQCIDGLGKEGALLKGEGVAHA